jgi:hypothetical protein
MTETSLAAIVQAAATGGAAPTPTTSASTAPVAPDAQTAARIDAARAEGRAEGAEIERVRCATILGSEEAKGREPTAAHLAFKTAMAPTEAIALLATTPKAEAPKGGSRLDALVTDPKVGAAPPPQSSAETAEAGLAAAVDRLIAKH